MGAVRELLEAMANPNAQDAEGCTPVFLAAQEGHEEVGLFVMRKEVGGGSGVIVAIGEGVGCGGWHPGIPSRPEGTQIRGSLAMKNKMGVWVRVGLGAGGGREDASPKA